MEQGERESVRRLIRILKEASASAITVPEHENDLDSIAKSISERIAVVSI
jgi:hypothetical protein